MITSDFDITNLPTFVQDVYIVKYIVVVSTCSVFYYYLLTLPSEIRYIWNSPWAFGKIVFLVIRYPPLAYSLYYLYYSFVTSISPTRCYEMVIALAWFVPAMVPPIQVLLVVRTAAIWENKRSIIIILSTSLVLMDAILFAFNHSLVQDYRLETNPPAGLKETFGCHGVVVFVAHPSLLVMYICVLVFDFEIFILTLVNEIRNQRLRRTKFLSVIYRDGMILYIVLFVTGILNTILYFLPAHRHVAQRAAVPIYFGCITILASQIILNMRQMAMESDDTISEHFIETRIVFAGHTIVDTSGR